MALTDTELSTWKAFINAHDRITRQINADLAAHDLPDLTWYDALWALRTGDGGRRRMGDLAEAVVLSRTAIVRLVDRLEAAGVARREPVPEDRRGSYVVITPEGKALLKRMWPIYSAGIEKLFAAHATKSMGAALDRMARGVRQPSPGPRAS
jgi:DNA-binding MarR family transcriptional regulator